MSDKEILVIGFLGFIVGALIVLFLSMDYVEDLEKDVEYLTQKTQEQFWQIEGFKQQIITYQWELDQCKTVHLEVNYEK